MAFLRSERVAAVLLVVAAALGLVLANSPAATAIAALERFRLGIPAVGIDLSLAGWVTDGLLAVFFFVAAIELRQELRHGELDSAAKALVPTVAAIGGVVLPAVIFLVLVRDPALARGWPIPTATDIAFALGVLAIAGRALPPRFRALLLAIAVIDDLIAILIIAVFFTAAFQPLPLVTAVPVVLLFGWLSYREGPRRWWIILALIVLGITAWGLVLLSGVHPTVAGLALGLIMADSSARRARRAIEPWSNWLVLPLFALVASLVPISTGLRELGPAFWAVLIALPVGKLLGITAGASIAGRLAGRSAIGSRIPLGDLIAIAGLGGIGFTVSLLMTNLAYRDRESVADQVTLAVMLASVIAAVIGATLTSLRNRHYRRLATAD